MAICLKTAGPPNYGTWRPPLELELITELNSTEPSLNRGAYVGLKECVWDVHHTTTYTTAIISITKMMDLSTESKRARDDNGEPKGLAKRQCVAHMTPNDHHTPVIAMENGTCDKNASLALSLGQGEGRNSDWFRANDRYLTFLLQISSFFQPWLRYRAMKVTLTVNTQSAHDAAVLHQMGSHGVLCGKTRELLRCLSFWPSYPMINSRINFNCTGAEGHTLEVQLSLGITGQSRHNYLPTFYFLQPTSHYFCVHRIVQPMKSEKETTALTSAMQLFPFLNPCQPHPD